MFDERHHPAVFSKMETKAKKHGTVQLLTVKMESAGEVQNLLESYGDQCNNAGNISQLFHLPIGWKSINLEAAYHVALSVELSADQDLDFRARLVGIKVARSWKNGGDWFTYSLALEKDLDPVVDKDLAHLVNAKQANERTGKPELVLWPILWEALEPVAQSVPEGEESHGEAGI